VKTKHVTTLLSIGILSGFIIGFFESGLNSAFQHTAANRYIHYKMHRLAASVLQGPLFKWLIITLFTACFLLFVTWLTGKLVSRTHANQKIPLKVPLIYVAWSLLFYPGIWAVNHYLIPYTKLHPISVLADVGILLFSLYVAGLLAHFKGKMQLKKQWEKLSETKFIKVTAMILVLSLLVINVGIFSYGKRKNKAAKRPNVLFIVIDALRQDHLGCFGYRRNTSPNINELAKEGILFKHAYSHAPWTKPSVASLFSSLPPNKHMAINKNDILPDEIPVIAEILKNEGYHTFCFVGGNKFIGKRFNFHQGFDIYRNSRINAAKLTKTLLSFISKPQEKRFFAYIHYMDVHLPYNKNKYNDTFVQKKGKHFFSPGKVRAKDCRKFALFDRLSIMDKKHLVSLYDGQIRYVDENIKRIISVLKKNNMLNDTLVIITADHGEEFWDHNNYEHGHTLYNELIHVPLVIAGNNLKNLELKRPVRLIDLLPTILKMVDVESSRYNLEGTPLFEKRGGKNNKLKTSIFAMGTLYGDEKYCLIRGDRKLIINTGDEEKKKNRLIGFRNKSKMELYDITKDPLEKENLVNTEHKEVSRLKKVLEEFINAQQMFKGKRAILDKETKEGLKSLGYL
jgi:choline-sulfatase